MSRWQELEPYPRAGYDLIPLVRRQVACGPTCPECKVKAYCPRRGKRPLHRGWRSNRYKCKELRRLFERDHNIGVRLGPQHLVVDVDPRNFDQMPEELGGGSIDSLVLLEADVGFELRGVAPHVLTGSGGSHYYFRKPADLPVVDSLLAYPGLEFKSSGRQVVAAGSIHPSEKPYAWDLGCPYLDDAPEAPETLLRLIRKPPPRKVEGAGQLNPEEVAFCLDQIDPCDHAGHDRWFSLMCASHFASGGKARSEFIAWSAANADFAHLSWQVGRRWDSLTVDRDGPQATTGTLFQAVLEAGGELPEGRAADDFDPVDDDEDEDAQEGDRLLNWMNARHCCITGESNFQVYSLIVDHVHGGRSWKRRSKRDFEDSLENRRVQIAGEKLERLSRWWLTHRKRSEYDAVIFDPEREREGCLNLWTGWAVEEAAGDWSLLRELIYEVLVDGEPAHAEFVLNWMAFLVQRPATPAEVALVFTGAKGTGKGTLARALVALAGRHGVHVNNRTHLVGRFNSHHRDKVVVFDDEAHWPGDVKDEATLKAMITEPTSFYEAKGIDGRMGRNCIHLIIAGQPGWVVPAGMDGERRFAVFDVNRIAKGDYARWDAINDQLYQHGGLAAMLYDLKRRDIAGWHPRSNIPRTRALEDQKLRGADELTEWWLELLENGRLPGAEGPWNGADVTVVAEDLQESLHIKCRRLGANRRAIATRLGHHLQRWAPGSRRKRVRVDGERVWTYQLPPLEVCRETFEEEFGREVDWGEEGD